MYLEEGKRESEGGAVLVIAQPLLETFPVLSDRRRQCAFKSRTFELLLNVMPSE